MSRHADPIEAMGRFLARTAPYHAPAGSPTSHVETSCRECGHLDGIFGATVAQHAARIAGPTD